MTGRYAWFLLFAVWSALTSTSGGQTSNIGVVLRQFPGYHLLTLQERDPYLKGFLAQHFPKSNPSVVHADFDGDGLQDYGLLLKSDKLGKTILVIVLCPADGQCKKVYELDEATYAAIVYLRPLAPGSKVFQTKAVDGSTAPVTLHSTGIRVTYFEKAEVVLYWNPRLREIKEVQTSD